MKPRHLALASSLIATLIVSSIPASAQTSEERQGARAAADAGAEAFEAGKWEEAADLFARAERLLHAPPHLLFSARALVKLGRLVEARENYLTLVQERLPGNAPKAFKDAQTAGDKELTEIEGRISYVSVVVQGTGAKDVKVTRDGKPIPSELVGVPHPVDAGKHEYQALAEGMESAPTTVQVKEGARETVVLTLYAVESAPKSSAPPTDSTASPAASSDARFDAAGSGSSGGMSGMMIGAFVGFGVAALGTGLGTYFVIASGSDRSDADDLFNECMPNCTPAQQNSINDSDASANSKRTVGVASFVVGGAGLATGITLLILDSGADTDDARGTVRPVLGLGYAGLRGKF